MRPQAAAPAPHPLPGTSWPVLTEGFLCAEPSLQTTHPAWGRSPGKKPKEYPQRELGLLPEEEGPREGPFHARAPTQAS